MRGQEKRGEDGTAHSTLKPVNTSPPLSVRRAGFSITVDILTRAHIGSRTRLVAALGPGRIAKSKCTKAGRGLTLDIQQHRSSMPLSSRPNEARNEAPPCWRKPTQWSSSF